MRDVREAEIRKAFINSSRSRATSATMPATWPTDLAEQDLVGWTDPKSPRRAYVTTEATGELVTLELRRPDSGGARGRSTLCDWCRTTDAPDGARLMVAQLAGPRGRAGDTVGVYVCEDFECSARARQPLKPHQISVSGAEDRRIPELVERVAQFVERVQRG